MKKCVVSVCKALISAEEKLNELDRGSGDGDCGSTLKAGAIGECEYKGKKLLTEPPSEVSKIL